VLLSTVSQKKILSHLTIKTSHHNKCPRYIPNETKMVFRWHTCNYSSIVSTVSSGYCYEWYQCEVFMCSCCFSHQWTIQTSHGKILHKSHKINPNSLPKPRML